MGKILLNRLDSRLAHGTVCNAWVPSLGVTDIVVIHDVYCNDEFTKKLHVLAAPPGCTMDTISTDEAARRWQADQFGEGKKLMILFGDVQTACAAYYKGFKFDALQVANISMIPGSKKVTVHKGVCMDRSEGDMLKKLQDEDGVKVYFQTFPQEPLRPLNDVLAKAKFKK